MNNDFKQHIELLADHKVSDDFDYEVRIDDNKMHTRTVIVFDDTEEYATEDEERRKLIIKDAFFQSYHPDNIDVVDFWTVATTEFPFFSVIGNGNIRTIEQVNAASLWLANHHGVLGAVEHILDLNSDKEKCKVLEIGCGHGGFYQWFQERHGETSQYFGLDVVKLFDCDTLALGDGYTIPETLPEKFDLIYSHNVFQHLSKKQRTSYFKEVSDRLEPAGMFIFGSFVQDEFNKDTEKLWGTETESGERLIHFFNQFTLAPTHAQLLEELGEVGMTATMIVTDEMTEEVLANTNGRNYIAMRAI